MANFYGEVTGRTKKATHRLGNTDIQVVAASWQGAIVVDMHTDKGGQTRVKITKTSWPGRDVKELIYEGPVRQVWEYDDTISGLGDDILQAG